jgi:hypothetical protein
MPNISKDEALKLALEALYGFIPYLPIEHDKQQCDRYDNAITAIKQSLTQKEGEPVTHEDLLGAVGRAWGYPCNSHKIMDSDIALAVGVEVGKLYAHPPAPLKPITAEDVTDEMRKDAAKWRLLVDGEIVIPASERLPEHTIVLARATTDQYGGFLSGVSDEDEYFDKLLIDAAIAGEAT